jgi:hypothetical protein
MNGDVMTEDEGVRLTETEAKRRRSRNAAIAVVLVGLVVLFYAITIVKMAPNLAHG